MAINVRVHWAEAQTTNEDNLMYWMCWACAVRCSVLISVKSFSNIISITHFGKMCSAAVARCRLEKRERLYAEWVGGWQWRHRGRNLSDRMPPSSTVYSPSRRFKCTIPRRRRMNERSTVLQRISSSKLPYLWLLFSLSKFSFLSLPTWHWCDAINSWEENLSVSCDWQYDLVESVRRIYYPSTVITSQFEQRDCFSCTRSPFPFNWLCDEQLKKNKIKNNERIRL